MRDRSLSKAVEIAGNGDVEKEGQEVWAKIEEIIEESTESCTVFLERSGLLGLGSCLVGLCCQRQQYPWVVGWLQTVGLQDQGNKRSGLCRESRE